MSSVRAGTQVVVVERILTDLLDHELPCAPWVAARLAERLDGDVHTIREVAALLDPAERAGLRPLPLPLPAVPTIVDRFADVAVAAEERTLLLTAAVSLDDGIGPVLAACARSVDDETALSQHLCVHAGRFRFVEQRFAIWIVAVSSPVMVVDAHRRLAAALRAAGEPATAVWHRARSSSRSDPASARLLVRAARELADAGDTERALLFASEAAAHANPADRDPVRLVAGSAAVGSGCMAEAAGWLAPMYPDGEGSSRLHGLAALLVAHAHLQGTVPDVDMALLRPQRDIGEDWHAWTRAAAFGAALCAERGDRQGARAWLDVLREGAKRTDADGRLRDPVVSLIWLLLGEGEADDASGTGAVTGVVLGALQRAVVGDVDGGLQVLATGESGVVPQIDPFIAGYERTDLIAAHRIVVEVLLHVWRGDIARARTRLCEASLTLPIAVPFAGLGVVLARRLDLAVLGRLGPFAHTLTAALPAPSRTDQLVDRAIRSHLAGEPNVATSCLRLWLDRGAPQTALSVPGLDEDLPIGADPAPRARQLVEPPDMALGRLLRTRAATSSAPIWRNEAAEVADAARAIASPFERARVESSLGTRALIDGDSDVARTHLRAAWQLFDESGATAWADAVADRLDGLGAEREAERFAAVRRRWESLLTPRELEVALIAVQGGSNRDIAGTLTVSVRTVEVHLGRVFTKLGVRSRIDLVLLGHRTARHG